MTDLELQFDASTTVKLVADLAPVSTATLTLFAPDGTTVQTPSVTKPTISTTTATGSTTSVLVLTSVTGIVAGTHLRVTSDGYAYTCEAATVDGTAKTVSLVTWLPAAPDAGCTVLGLDCTATVTAPGATLLGSAYRLVWTCSDGTTTSTTSQPASIVRWRWTPSCTAADVRNILSEMGQKRAGQWCGDVADRVDQVIQAKLLQTGKRPWLYLSSSVFADAARAQIRYELSQQGIALGGQIYEAQRELRFAADDKIATVITGLQGILDTDNDGKISAAEQKPRGRTVQVTR